MIAAGQLGKQLARSSTTHAHPTDHPTAHLPDDGGGKRGKARLGAGAVALRRALQRAQALAHHVLRENDEGVEAGRR